MHSCFVWATCSKTENLEAISSITTFRITARELPEFLWRCLITDLQDLSKILGRGLEECAVVLHLVLRQIQITSIPTEGSNLLIVLIYQYFGTHFFLCSSPAKLA